MQKLGAKYKHRKQNVCLTKKKKKSLIQANYKLERGGEQDTGEDNQTERHRGKLSKYNRK